MRFLQPVSKLVLILGAAAWLAGCGGGGGGTPTPVVTILALPSGSPVSGQQSLPPKGTTLFEITGLTPGTPYQVSIPGTIALELIVFSDSALNNFLCSSLTAVSSANCSAVPPGVSLFVQVNDPFVGLGGSFTLEVSVANVTVLNFAGSLSETGLTVSAATDRLFEIAGVNAGTPYRVSITGTNTLGLTVYNDPGFDNPLCGLSSVSGSVSCSAVPSGASLFVRVNDKSGLGDSFTLEVIEEPVIELIFPVGGLSETGLTVAAASDRLFQITNLTPGTLYNVSIAGANATELIVYNDPGLSNILCISSVSAGSGSCTGNPPGASIFVRVTNDSEIVDSFILAVIETPVTVLSFDIPGNLPATGQTISDGLEKLYEITGLIPETFYNVSIAGNVDINLSVFNDLGLSEILCGSGTLTGNEGCIAAPSGTSLFLQVDTFSLSAGIIFTLAVIEAPITVLDFAGGISAVGQIISPGGERLYEIKGLTTEIPYSVSFEGTEDINLVVYNIPTLAFFACTSVASSGPGSCITTPFFPSGTSLFVRVIDASGSVGSFTLKVIEAPVTVLSFDIPGNLPATGQTISAAADRLFQITNVTSATPHLVSVAGTSSAELFVFDDLGLRNFLCSSFTNTGLELNCSAVPSDTSFFLRVRNFSESGANFTLNVLEEPP